jgi:hypothetical protein
MPYRAATGLCRNCGQIVSFFAAIKTDQAPAGAKAICVLCGTKNVFGGRSARVGWSGILAASPKESVLAAGFSRNGDLGKPEDGVGLLVEGLLELLWQAFGEKIRLVGEDRLTDSKTRLVEEISRFHANVDPKGHAYMLLLSRRAEEVLLEMVGRRHGRWDFRESQKLRSILTDFASLFLEGNR